MVKKQLRSDCLAILETGVQAVDPKTAMKDVITIDNENFKVGGKTYNLNRFDQIYAVGGGKASGKMAEALEKMLGSHLTKGFVNVLKGTKEQFDTEFIELTEADHPIPDKVGMKGAKKIVNQARDANENDLVITLISGGGSALMCLPAEGISLEDLKETTEKVMKAGASINELNAVRKHISAIKGGQLAQAIFPAQTTSLIISDVVGDPLDVIASGPTAPDTTTFQDAKNVLTRYNLWNKVPQTISQRISQGIQKKISETPKPNNKVFNHVNNQIIANNRRAMLKAEKKAQTLGYHTQIISSYIEGEAREVGTVLGAIALEHCKHGTEPEKPLALLGGGETTVTVTGDGKGGRNQEIALGAALKIANEEGIVIASLGTDGIDGNSDAAGAMVDGATIPKAKKRDMDPFHYLQNNDSYTFFKKLDELIVTEPTGTNVNDLLCILIDSKDQ